jgi:hypothetical protein
MNRIEIPVKKTTTFIEFDAFSPRTVRIMKNGYFPYVTLVFTAGDNVNMIEIALHFDNKEVLRDTLKQLLKEIGK